MSTEFSQDDAITEDQPTAENRRTGVVYALPPCTHLPLRNLGYSCMILATVSFITGILVYQNSKLDKNPGVSSAINIWGGILVSLAAIVYYTKIYHINKF